MHVLFMPVLALEPSTENIKKTVLFSAISWEVAKNIVFLRLLKGIMTSLAPSRRGPVGSSFLDYGSHFLYYRSIFLYYGSNLLYCGSNFLYYGSIFLYYRNIFPYCGNNFLYYRSSFLD